MTTPPDVHNGRESDRAFMELLGFGGRSVDQALDHLNELWERYDTEFLFVLMYHAAVNAVSPDEQRFLDEHRDHNIAMQVADDGCAHDSEVVAFLLACWKRDAGMAWSLWETWFGPDRTEHSQHVGSAVAAHIVTRYVYVIEAEAGTR